MNRATQLAVQRVIDKWSSEPFTYSADCCRFVAAVARAVSGSDFMHGFNYTTEHEAKLLIAAAGSLQNIMVGQFGAPISPTAAIDGDVLLIDFRRVSPALADRVGDESAGVKWRGRCIVRTLTGLTDWPMNRAALAWRLPCHQ